jgi:hypothetical protein
MTITSLEEHVERMRRNTFVGVSAVSTRIMNPFTKNNCPTTQRDKNNFLDGNMRGFLNLKMQLPQEEEEEEGGKELSCTTTRMRR